MKNAKKSTSILGDARGTGRKTGSSIVGLLFTVAVTAGFLWAAAQWYQRDNWPLSLSVEDIRKNEILAFKNIEQVMQAQRKYNDVDWDDDGRTTYAAFIAHLWMSVTRNNTQIAVNLLPRKLGFAMSPAAEVNGYYFRNFGSKEFPATSSVKKLDYENEWAMACIPAIYGKTGKLAFLFDHTGQIFVSDSRSAPVYYPGSLPSDEWTRIRTIRELQDFQSGIHYSRDDE